MSNLFLHVPQSQVFLDLQKMMIRDKFFLYLTLSFQDIFTYCGYSYSSASGRALKLPRRLGNVAGIIVGVAVVELPKSPTSRALGYYINWQRISLSVHQTVFYQRFLYTSLFDIFFRHHPSLALHLDDYK